MAISVLLALLALSRERAFQQAQLDREAGLVAAIMQRELDLQREIVESVGRAFQFSEPPSREEFAALAGAILQRHPVTVGLSRVPRASEVQRSIMELAAREQGLVDYQFRGFNSDGDVEVSGPAEVYYPTFFVEPLDANSEMVGFDLRTDPARLEALEVAAGTSRTIASRWIPLFQEFGSPHGYVVVSPVYRANPREVLPADRSDEVVGFVVGTFSLDDLVRVGVRWAGATIDIFLTDETARRDLRLGLSFKDRVAAIEPVDEAQSEAESTGLVWAGEVRAPGRIWSIRGSTNEECLSGVPIFETYWVLAGGMLTTLVAAGYSIASGRRARRIRRLDLDLLRGEAQMQAIVGAVAVPVLIFKADLTALLYVNLRARDTLSSASGSDGLIDLYRVFNNSLDIDVLSSLLGPELRLREHEITIANPSGGLQLRFSLIAEPVEFDRQPAVAVVLHDLTQRVRIETELRESQQSLARAQAIAHTGSWTWDRETGAINCSDELLRILGTDVEGSVTTYENVIAYVHPDDRERVDQAIRTAAEDAQSFDIEHRIVQLGGDVREVHQHSEVERNYEGRTTRIYGIMTDVTEQRRYEQRDRLRSAAMESAAHAIVITSTGGVIETVNPAFERLTGYSPAEALGQNLSVLDAEPGIQGRFDSMWSTVKSGRVWQGELSVRRKDRSVYEGEMTVTPVRDQRGEISNYVAINQDITERRRAVQLEIENVSLSQSARMKDDFLANMSHELRTPLNAVIGLSQALAGEVFGEVNEDQMESVEMINTAGKHLLALINDILDISRIAAGDFELKLASLSAVEVSEAALRIVESAARERDVIVLRDLDVGADAMIGDQRRIVQILVNLLTNAVKFTPEQGSVGLELRQDNGMMQFAVWDTGIGIAEEDLPHLFQRFVQLDSSLGRKFEGTGMGLAVVHQLAELHGGSVKVESAVGRGSRFTAFLPLDGPGPNVRSLGTGNPPAVPPGDD